VATNQDMDGRLDTIAIHSGLLTTEKHLRAKHIQFNGYRRLADTGCNTDGKMIAFLGPNEAGKSTVLSALDWFSHGGGLGVGDANSTSPPTEGAPVVTVRFWLEDGDVGLLRDELLTDLPTELVVSKRPDGSVEVLPEPRIRRDPSAIAEAQTLLPALIEDLRARAAGESPALRARNVERWLSALELMLADADATWDDSWAAPFDELDAFLRRPSTIEGVERELPEHTEAADVFVKVRELLETLHPEAHVVQKLGPRVPEFALFGEGDRTLRSTYALNDDALRASPPKALENLAWVAELDLEALWQDVAAANTRGAQTRERRANERLKSQLGDRWRQRQIDVRFNVDGLNLQIIVSELDQDGADTPFDERSDGLKIFVALVAFLSRHNYEVPPILLVDEAETHLHYDAQADLLEVLTRDVRATQVFYTTHSPGCLPKDLGTGVRLVAPRADRSDASELRNDFWTSSEPGFTPLLFAMGASAAAFSSLRRAVIAEGASDMILLPSLFRLATGLDELDFQVAPGLANYHGSGLELEEVAAHVVYLVDGDDGGDAHRERLIGMGVRKDRVLQLPRGVAPEDLVDEELYIGVINGLLSSRRRRLHISSADLDRSLPISKAIDALCIAKGMKAPGKPAVAAHLVADAQKLRLSPASNAVLRSTHAAISKALKSAR
jgi:hypothetical protein